MCTPEKKNIEKPIVKTSIGLTGAQKYTDAQPKNSGKMKPNIGFQYPQSIFFFLPDSSHMTWLDLLLIGETTTGLMALPPRILRCAWEAQTQ